MDYSHYFKKVALFMGIFIITISGLGIYYCSSDPEEPNSDPDHFNANNRNTGSTNRRPMYNYFFWLQKGEDGVAQTYNISKLKSGEKYFEKDIDVIKWIRDSHLMTIKLAHESNRLCYRDNEGVHYLDLISMELNSIKFESRDKSASIELRSDCRSFIKKTADQSAHVDFLTGLMVPIETKREDLSLQMYGYGNRIVYFN